MSPTMTSDNKTKGSSFLLASMAAPAASFPIKLYMMLEDASEEGFDSIISWQPGGDSFKVHHSQTFTDEAMQKYFSHTKYKSFQRQLNIYGWKKIQFGPNKGGYKHPHFVRGRPDLFDKILRHNDSKTTPTSLKAIKKLVDGDIEEEMRTRNSGVSYRSSYWSPCFSGGPLLTSEHSLFIDGDGDGAASPISGHGHYDNDYQEVRGRPSPLTFPATEISSMTLAGESTSEDPAAGMTPSKAGFEVSAGEGDSSPYGSAREAPSMSNECDQTALLEASLYALLDEHFASSRAPLSRRSLHLLEDQHSHQHTAHQHHFYHHRGSNAGPSIPENITEAPSRRAPAGSLDESGIKSFFDYYYLSATSEVLAQKSPPYDDWLDPPSNQLPRGAAVQAERRPPVPEQRSTSYYGRHHELHHRARYEAPHMDDSTCCSGSPEHRPLASPPTTIGSSRSRRRGQSPERYLAMHKSEHRSPPRRRAGTMPPTVQDRTNQQAFNSWKSMGESPHNSGTSFNENKNDLKALTLSEEENDLHEFVALYSGEDWWEAAADSEASVSNPTARKGKKRPPASISSSRGEFTSGTTTAILPAQNDDNNGDTKAAESSNNMEEDNTVSSSFPFKLHLLLENADRDGYSDVISWLKDGHSFKVHDSAQFVKVVMPVYFDQSKYESFRRQLNLYQFTRISRGRERGIISHPCFTRGYRYLCREIKRN